MNVAFFIFNRPDTTQRVFDAIAAAKPQRLMVICDGARLDRDGEAALVQQTRAIINQVNWPCEVTTNYSDDNLGCKYRVASGLKWVFEQVEDAIVLEDDCLPHPSFFAYCTELLDRYRDDLRIGAISGDNFQLGVSRTNDSYYFSKYFHCWGWAAWRRSFDQLDLELDTWHEFKQSSFLKTWAGSPAEHDYWEHLFDLQQSGEICSWAYPWFYSCWANSSLTILPNVNLISNIGFDENATHTTSTENQLANLPVFDIGPLRHPKMISRNHAADQHTFENVFRPSSSENAQSPPSSVFKTIKKMFRRRPKNRV
jgi:hypothetical protein